MRYDENVGDEVQSKVLTDDVQMWFKIRRGPCKTGSRRGRQHRGVCTVGAQGQLEQNRAVNMEGAKEGQERAAQWSKLMGKTKEPASSQY